MKNRFATIVLVSILGLTGMGLVSCGEPTPNAQYTGIAVVESSHFVSSKKHSQRKCNVKVAFPDETVEKRRIKSIHSFWECNKVKTGGTVTLEKGKIVSYEKK